MTLEELTLDPTCKKNPHVRANHLSKTRNSFNIYLRPTQAIEAARCLLEKAQLLLAKDVDDAVVHVWCVGEDSETIYFGQNRARKSAYRRK